MSEDMTPEEIANLDKPNTFLVVLLIIVFFGIFGGGLILFL